ncbi:MAG: FAD-dependent oxidoreductase, partial [Candidatus Limnocylindria bacterium]
NRPAAATARAAAATDAEPPSLFSIASARGVSTLGSTFLPAEPDPDRLVPLLLRRGAVFLPAIGVAPLVGRRVCARPQSVDGLPFIGPVPGMDGLFVCAGHGPWGISTGPGSAALAVAAMLEPGTHPIPGALSVSRVTGGAGTKE